MPADPVVALESDGTAFAEVQCHCSDDDGVPDVGVSVGLGCGKALWIGELLTRDGATCGMVMHDGTKRIVAPFADGTDWQDAADILRHHVGPALAAHRTPAPAGDVREGLIKTIAKALAAKQIDAAVEGSGLGLTRMSSEAREQIIEADHTGWLDEARYVADALAVYAPAPSEIERRGEIRRSINRQLSYDPHADRVILEGFEWDVVLEALASPTPDSSAVSGSAEGLREAFLAGFDVATKLLDDSIALGDPRWPEVRTFSADKYAALTEGQQS